MGKVLDELRDEYAQEDAGKKWWQRRAEGDAMLYLGARMRDWIPIEVINTRLAELQDLNQGGEDE